MHEEPCSSDLQVLFDVLRRAMVIMQHRFIVPLEADDYLGLGYSVKKNEVVNA